jgi:hypothetical protein
MEYKRPATSKDEIYEEIEEARQPEYEYGDGWGQLDRDSF